jgi:hypothetical protein
MTASDASFEQQAERARKAIEAEIALLSGDMAAEVGGPLTVILWAIVSGAVTAAAHTLSIITQESAAADEKMMVEALKYQLGYAYDQAVGMHPKRMN